MTTTNTKNNTPDKLDTSLASVGGITKKQIEEFDELLGGTVGKMYLARTVEYDGQPAGVLFSGWLVGDYDGEPLVRPSLVGYGDEAHHLAGGIFCELLAEINNLRED